MFHYKEVWSITVFTYTLKELVPLAITQSQLIVEVEAEVAYRENPLRGVSFTILLILL